jgi:hypothetical protein
MRESTSILMGYVFGILLLGGLVVGFGFYLVRSLTEKQSMKGVASAVLPLIKDCREDPNKEIVVRGKVLAWDVAANGEHAVAVQGRIPDKAGEIEAGTDVTVFLISEKRRQVGVWVPSGRSISGEEYRNASPAYSVEVRIHVAYWPQMKPVGVHSLTVYPPKYLSETYSDGIGDVNGAIASWIASLKRGG